MLGRPHEFTPNRVFKPRLMLIDREQPIPEQVERLLAVDEHVPVLAATPEVFDDMDWDGTWLRSQAEDYVKGI